MREDRVPHHLARRCRRDPTRHTAQGQARNGEPEGGAGGSTTESDPQNSEYRTRTKNHVRTPWLPDIQRDPGAALERAGRKRNQYPDGYRYDDLVFPLRHLR
jgi:hypothetical protein